MTVRESFNLIGIGFVAAALVALVDADHEWRVLFAAFAASSFLLGSASCSR